jgi:hypothetical protein
MAVRQSSPELAAIVPPRAIAYEGRRGRNDNAEERMTTSDPGPRIVTACVLIIGNEILSGRTQDANLAFLAQVGVRSEFDRPAPSP